MFTEQMIEQLRQEYSTIERMDPNGKSCKNLIKIIGKMDDKTIIQVVKAKINFVSALALNVAVRRKLKLD